jgi:endonuclease YncB( thermonuclease family)
MKMQGRKLAASWLAGAAALATVGAGAQGIASAPAPPLRVASDCAGGNGVSGEVASVIDGKSFLFTDGREVRLAAIEPPPLEAAGRYVAQAGAGLAAKAALEALARHRQVVLSPAGPSPDRYGRLVAYVFIMGPSGEISVQHELLANGHALLSPSGTLPACRIFLRAAERAARAAKLGLWGDPCYGVKQADNLAELLSAQGQFALVGGKVASVRESGGIVYVNFGRRWSEEFTVTILKRNERLFAGAGLAPSRLAGRRIEVRGFVEERRGPAIEAARPEQIEIVDLY